MYPPFRKLENREMQENPTCKIQFLPTMKNRYTTISFPFVFEKILQMFLCLLFLFCTSPLLAADQSGEASQDLVVTGVVTDAVTNAPLPGVNIVIEGTVVGTATNIDG